MPGLEPGQHHGHFTQPQHLNRYRQIAWLPHLGLSGAGDHFFFLAAAGGGIALLINILFYDKPGPD